MAILGQFHFRTSTAVILLLAIHSTCGYMIASNPTRRGDLLDPEGKYLLEWTVDWSKNTIHFNVTVKTTGWILFGLANDNQIPTGADLVIGGIFGGDKKGKPYFIDGYTEKQRWLARPKSDLRHDYVLNSFWETGSKTFLSFSRPLDTCDPQDYPITDNKVTLLWGYGETDDFNQAMIYHQGYYRTGAKEIYLLDPEYTPRIVKDDFARTPKVFSKENLSIWTIPRRLRIPENDTAYLCSMHKAPNLFRKHHVVGFDIRFADDESRLRVHHLLVYKCNLPGGNFGSPRTLFEPFVGAPPEACYFPQLPPSPSSSQGSMPTHFCTQLYTAWAIGGGAYFHPPDVGFPLGSSPEEYYMLQIHYDNPQQITPWVSLKLDFFYTSHLRPNEAGFLGIGHDVPGLPPSFLIPPQSTNHRIFGHCSPQCTKRMVPSEGIQFVAMFLHSHTSGQRLRLRHFRKDQELPWILYDDNYSNQFQPIRHLRQERKILPGDQLTMDCTFDNSWTNGTVLGGFTTKQEMCMAFVVYYNQLDYNYCRSEIVSPAYRKYFLHVDNVTWSESRLDWVVTAPKQLEGITVTEIGDNLEWDGGKRQQLQRLQEGHAQVGKCSKDIGVRGKEEVEAILEGNGGNDMLRGVVPERWETANDYHGPVSYPFRARAYVPPKTCSYVHARNY